MAYPAKQIVPNLTVLILFALSITTYGAAHPDAPKPPAAPPAAKAGDAGAAAIKTAVAALTTEYADFEKDQTKVISADCNYFKKNPSGDVTQQQILTALNARYGSDTNTDAYVKWQLLSAIPGKWDDALIRGGLSAYQQSLSMQLASSPAINHGPLDAMASKLNAKTSPEEVSGINDHFKEAVKKTETINQPIIAYRNQLFALLPGSPDAFNLGMQDAVNRASRGVSGDSIMASVKAAITEWVSDAKPGQLKAMADALHQLSMLAASDKYMAYSVLAGEKGVYKWSKEGLIDAKSLETLADTLKKDVAHPPEQLGFKKEE